MLRSQLWAPAHPVCLTWEVTLGPGQVGDNRLGSGFKVAAVSSGLGTEDGREAVLFPVDPRRRGGTLTEAVTAREGAAVAASVPPASPPLPQPEWSPDRVGVFAFQGIVLAPNM